MPVDETIPLDAEALEAALIAGWNACRKSVYAVCEDIQERAANPAKVSLSSTDEQRWHEKGYYFGEAQAAKGIARGFNSMEAMDDDNVRAALAYLSRAARQQDTGTFVLVPQSALDWLFGAGPDAGGNWFGAVEDAVEPMAALQGNKPRYWWRTHFRKLIEPAAPTPPDQGGGTPDAAAPTTGGAPRIYFAGNG